MYIGSLILFYLHITSTIMQQAHATSQMSKMQKKLFISVSLVLLCFTAFYVFPSTLQMLKRVYYFYQKILYDLFLVFWINWKYF